MPNIRPRQQSPIDPRRVLNGQQPIDTRRVPIGHNIDENAKKKKKERKRIWEQQKKAKMSANEIPKKMAGKN